MVLFAAGYIRAFSALARTSLISNKGKTQRRNDTESSQFRPLYKVFWAILQGIKLRAEGAVQSMRAALGNEFRGFTRIDDTTRVEARGCPSREAMH
jgi:hypothetical protein